jgi:hypothetical protein
MMDDLSLDFPDENTTEDVISALRNKDTISQLDCEFSDDAFIASKDMRDALLMSSSHMLGEIEGLTINNVCLDPEIHTECFDFFLRYMLNGQQQNKYASNIGYMTYVPWKFTEAKRVASAIISSHRRPLYFISLSGFLFRKKGTFECVLNAALDGAVEGLAVGVDYILDLKHGCIGRSNLASNTTLKELHLYFWGDNYSYASDEGMEELANALKSNRGLESIFISGRYMTNVGRRYLLESLRDNITLFNFDTRNDVVGNDQDNNINEELELQSQIDRQIKLNRFWHKYKLQYRDGDGGDGGDDDADNDADDDSYSVDSRDDGYADSDSDYVDSDSEDEDEDDMDEDKVNGNDEQDTSTRQTISFEIYPAILEVFAKKPLLLYKFLREEDHSQLFGLGSFSDRPEPHRRRTSKRPLKKRRLTAPGSAY